MINRRTHKLVCRQRMNDRFVQNECNCRSTHRVARTYARFSMSASFMERIMVGFVSRSIIFFRCCTIAMLSSAIDLIESAQDARSELRELSTSKGENILVVSYMYIKISMNYCKFS